MARNDGPEGPNFLLYWELAAALGGPTVRGSCRNKAVAFLRPYTKTAPGYGRPWNVPTVFFKFPASNWVMCKQRQTTQTRFYHCYFDLSTQTNKQIKKQTFYSVTDDLGYGVCSSPGSKITFLLSRSHFLFIHFSQHRHINIFYNI